MPPELPDLIAIPFGQHARDLGYTFSNTPYAVRIRVVRFWQPSALAVRFGLPAATQVQLPAKYPAERGYDARNHLVQHGESAVFFYKPLFYASRAFLPSYPVGMSGFPFFIKDLCGKTSS